MLQAICLDASCHTFFSDFLPVCVQIGEAFRGHLLLTFMAAVVVKWIQDRLKDSPYNPISMLLNMKTEVQDLREGKQLLHVA